MKRIQIKIVLVCLTLVSSTILANSNTPILNAMVIVPQEFDDIEFATVIDTFKKANIKITAVGVGGLKVKSVSGLQISTNRTLDKVTSSDFQVLIVLGSSTATYYSAYPDVESIIHSFYNEDKLIGATSLAPLLLDKAGILNRRTVTVDPAVSGKLSRNVVYSANKAVIDGNIVTSFAPGSAAHFALLIIQELQGSEVADRVKAELYL